MPGLVHFLRCIGRAAVRHGGRALAGLLPFGGPAFEIARDACEEYRREYGEYRLHAELCALKRTTRVEVGTVSAHLPAPADRGALLAVGDVADVFLAADGQHLLKKSREPEGTVFLHRERLVLAQLRAAAERTTYRHYLPAPVVVGPTDGKVNVFRYEPGLFTLEQVHERCPALEGRHLGWIFKRLLAVLGFCHRQGVIHGAVLPCHVLLHVTDHGLRLVGWGQSVAPGRRLEAVPARYRDWYPPEAQRRQPATPATDLFLAARCLVYLAGGDPLTDRMLGSVPTPLHGFLRGCLLAGPRMRPHDAWRLHDEFDALLLRLYGSPKFFPLTLP